MDAQKSVSRDVVVRLHKVLESVMHDKPLGDVVKVTMNALQTTFGMRDLKFVAHSSELRSTHQDPSDEKEHEALHALHLREGDRVSPNGFFTRSEDMLKSFAGDMSDSISGWREDDSLWFVVRGRSGEPVACLHVGGMESGRLPSMSEVECADLLIQIIGLAVHKEQERAEREQRSSSMVRKSDLLEDILRIASSVVSERDLNKVSEMVLSSVSSLFGFEKVSLVTYDQGAAAFKWTALFGYPEHAARETKLRTIPMEVVLEDLRESRRIAKTVYFTPMEDLPRRNIEYFVDPEAIEVSTSPLPRGQGEFREGDDTLAFALHDSTSRVVGVIYTSRPKDGRVPDRENPRHGRGLHVPCRGGDRERPADARQGAGAPAQQPPHGADVEDIRHHLERAVHPRP